MTGTISRRDFMRLTGLGLSALGLAACGSQMSPMGNNAGAGFTPMPQAGLTPSGEGLQPMQGFQAIPANSRLVVGANRVALGLIENGKSVKDAQVHIRFFDLNADPGQLKGEVDATY